MLVSLQMLWGSYSLRVHLRRRGKKKDRLVGNEGGGCKELTWLACRGVPWVAAMAVREILAGTEAVLLCTAEGRVEEGMGQ